MEKDDPKLWDYAINKLGYGAVLDFINVPYQSNVDIKKTTEGEYYQQYKII